MRVASDAVPVTRMELVLALFVESVTEVAIRVTVPPEGTDDGAV